MRRLPLVARTTACLVVCASAPCIWSAGQADASWVESLVMPGEVIERHARVEHECEQCHEPFDKGAQDRLCLACHHDVAADLNGGRGYHGQAPPIRGRPCKTCHTEHQGRRANIVRLDRETFEHRLTDLPLRGRHGQVPCGGCHSAGKRYREAPSDCSDCHAHKDPHDGCLGLACNDCHGESGWAEARFDHDAGAFPLEGRHRKTRCESCHPTKRYKPTSATCSECHERDDKHEGRLGSACESCHTARGWSATVFDHARKTHFPLLGQHARTPCESCHTDRLSPGRAPTACHACHQDDDAHDGKFGPACETCHTAVDWKRHTFEHARSTRYPLRGRHAELRCTECHRGELYGEHLETSCHACHRDDDVHRGQEGQRCEKCHDEHGWRRQVLFDHDLTPFPLLGAHARVVCSECHTSPAFKDVARACVSCHEEADVHHGRLGTRCSDCHNAASWRTWEFDHDRQTTFRLDGAHARTACEACHREPTERIALSPRCVSCHESDDVHRGQFGVFCERCHDTSDFRVVRAIR